MSSRDRNEFCRFRHSDTQITLITLTIKNTLRLIGSEEALPLRLSK